VINATEVAVARVQYKMGLSVAWFRGNRSLALRRSGYGQGGPGCVRQ
jgi:hypothetical protein